MRLGLIGCGRLAERGWGPAIEATAGAELVAVADRDPARCAAVAPGVQAFDGAARLAAGGGVDGVVIATPPESHLADAIEVAAAALPALVEKPPAATADDACALVALAPAPLIGFNRRFEIGIQRLRSALPLDGELAIRLSFRYRRRAWAPYVVHDDALLDVGPHLFDLARWLTRSAIVSVRALALDHERALADVRLSRGRASVECDADAPYRELVEVAQNGRVVRASRHGGLRRLIARRESGLRGRSPLVASLAAELEEFCAVVRGEEPRDLASAADGLAVMAAIEAVRISIANGGAWIDVEPRLPNTVEC